MSIIRSRSQRPIARWLGSVVVVGAVVASPTRLRADDEPPVEPRAAAKAPREGGWQSKDSGSNATRESTAKSATPTDASPTPPTFSRADAPSRRRVSATTSPGSGASSLAAERSAVEKVTAKTTIDEILSMTLPGRTDRPVDWLAGPEALHRCGDPRWIEPCIPPPPCHPSQPPAPWDLVGVAGDPTCGPIYRGPCCPRTGTHDGGPLPAAHRLHDRLFDAFYRTK